MKIKCYDEWIEVEEVSDESVREHFYSDKEGNMYFDFEIEGYDRT